MSILGIDLGGAVKPEAAVQPVDPGGHEGAVICAGEGDLGKVERTAGLPTELADKLDRLGPPCGRTDIVKDCSVVHRMVIDYGDLRRCIRAAKDD